MFSVLVLVLVVSSVRLAGQERHLITPSKELNELKNSFEESIYMVNILI